MVQPLEKLSPDYGDIQTVSTETLLNLSQISAGAFSLSQGGIRCVNSINLMANAQFALLARSIANRRLVGIRVELCPTPVANTSPSIMIVQEEVTGFIWDGLTSFATPTWSKFLTSPVQITDAVLAANWQTMIPFILGMRGDGSNSTAAVTYNFSVFARFTLYYLP